MFTNEIRTNITSLIINYLRIRKPSGYNSGSNRFRKINE